jgi:putative membrane-bound dehydrogenase-like protein
LPDFEERNMTARRCLLAALTLAFCVRTVDSNAESKIWTLPADSEFQPARLKVPEGFSIEVVAPPPLVAHPTMACFDDRGRLFVAENAGVNLSAAELEEQLPNSVRMLEDTNGDGRFDKATLFADKMTFPMGGAWHDGALFVASPPNIWRLEDTTGDGVADKRDILVNKFGYSGNAASVHGCFAGPDGRIYWCDGRHGHEFRDKDGNVTSKRDGSYIFSCEPDGSDVRIHCGGGMDNPVEVDFTEEGEILGTVNIFYNRPRVDCLVHWLHGGAYPHYEKVLGEFQRTGDLLGPVHNFGHVAISGTMRYRSDSFGKEFQNNFFATFFNGGKVVRVELERKGASFSATQREFLAAEGNDFHPTDVLEDADGSILVVDTGGWFYRGCPTSQIARPEIPGAIYRIRRDDAKPIDDPRGLKIDWQKLSRPDLASLLDDDRPAVAKRAIDEVVRRREPTIGSRGQDLDKRSDRAKRNSIWAATRIGLEIEQRFRTGRPVPTSYREPAQVFSVVSRGLVDESQSVRQAACRSVATLPHPFATFPNVAVIGGSFVDTLIEIVKTDEPPVRREAAKALGRIGDASAIPSLLSALARDGGVDRTEEHTLIYALIEIGDAEATAAGLKLESAATIRGALIALDQMDSGRVTVDQVAPLLDSDDAALRRTAVEIVGRRADSASRVASQLGLWLSDDARVKARRDTLGQLVAGFAGDAAVASVVGRELSSPESSEETRRLLLKTLADQSSLPLHDSWVAPIEKQLVAKSPEDVELGLSVASAIQTDKFKTRFAEISADKSRSTLLRVAALEAASGRDARLSEPAFALLTGLLSGDATAAESARAAQLLGNASLTPAQLVDLAPHLSLAGPIQIRDLIRPFLRDRRPEVAVAFLDAMEEARSLLTLPVPLFSDVVKRYPDDLRGRANSLLDRVKAEEARQVEQVDRLLPLLRTGDADNGRKVFFGKKSKCATCHRVGKEGERIGPDLTTIGANRSAPDLLESIVLPSATIVRDYDPYSVVTTQGKVISGLIVRDTKEAIHIQPQTGEPVVIPRGQVESVTPATVSIMPKGLEQALSEKELADVVAFLKSLR